MKKKTLYSLFITLFVFLWILPPPTDLSTQGWHLFLLFLFTIIGILTKPLPMGAIAMISIAAVSITQTLRTDQVLEGFAKKEIWLILFAFFITRAFIKTQLGIRIAYHFISLFGKKTLGLAYSLALSEGVISPAIPSATARSGGIFFPIIYSLSTVFKSHPHDKSAKRLGTFLVLNSFQASMNISALSLTAMAGNAIIASLAADLGLEITWGVWIKGTIIPGLFALFLSPLMVYILSPPEIRKTSAAHEIAQKKLKEMGKMSRDEKYMIGTFFTLITLWIFGKYIHLDATAITILGVSFLLCTKVLNWQDILQEKGAWEAFLWFGTLTSLASYLNKLGVTHFLSQQMIPIVSGMDWPQALGILSLFYFYSHYFFAGSIPHITAMYIPFLAVALQTGAPPILAALLLAVLSNLFGGLTHYASGPAPIYFGSGFCSLKRWWRVGFIMSLCNLFIWIVVGAFWCKFIGYW